MAPQQERIAGPIDAANRGPAYLRGSSVRSATGFTVLDLLVKVGILGIMVGFAVPQLSNSDFAIVQAREQLVSDLRNTRADALISGDHFRLDVTGRRTHTSYRTTLVDDVWTPTETPVRNRTLPDGLAFTAGVGASFEFNTRGLLVTPGTTETIEIMDSRSGMTEQITVWPSGQVAP